MMNGSIFTAISTAAERSEMICKTCSGPNESRYKNCLTCRKAWRNYNLIRANPTGYKRRVADLEAENKRLSKKIRDLQAVTTWGGGRG